MLEQPLTGSSRSPRPVHLRSSWWRGCVHSHDGHNIVSLVFPTWHRDRTSTWQRVVQGDPLVKFQQRHHQIRKSLGVVRPGIYEFEPLNSLVLRSKISERKTHSVTTLGFLSSSETFERYIKLREGHACGVTRMPVHLDKLLCLISS